MNKSEITAIPAIKYYLTLPILKVTILMATILGIKMSKIVAIMMGVIGQRNGVQPTLKMLTGFLVLQPILIH